MNDNKVNIKYNIGDQEKDNIRRFNYAAILRTRDDFTFFINAS